MHMVDHRDLLASGMLQALAQLSLGSQLIAVNSPMQGMLDILLFRAVLKRHDCFMMLVHKLLEMHSDGMLQRPSNSGRLLAFLAIR